MRNGLRRHTFFWLVRKKYAKKRRWGREIALTRLINQFVTPCVLSFRYRSPNALRAGRTISAFVNYSTANICSADFLLQLVEFRRGEKLTKRHIQAVAELFDRCDRYFPSARIHHTIYRGRCQAGACRKLIQMHVSFLADPLKPTHNCILNTHHNHLCGIFGIRKTFRFRRQKYSPHCNSVQRESCAPPEGRSLTDALREMERRISLSFLRASAIPLSGVSFFAYFFLTSQKKVCRQRLSPYMRRKAGLSLKFMESPLPPAG